MYDSNYWICLKQLEMLKNIVGKGENPGYQETFNPFPNKPWFLRVYSISLLKTLWEKEKFLLFPQCFLPIWMDFLAFSSSLKLSSA